MKNVLIISNNPLSDTQHNAKTILSLLGNKNVFSIRQVYFRDDEPSYPDCSYFKVTDREVLRSIIPFERKAGMRVGTLKEKKYDNKNSPVVPTNSYVKRLARELVWKVGRIDYKSLREWIDEERVDIIFFVGGDSVFAYNLVERIISWYKKPLILFITDDYLLQRNKGTLPFEIRRRMLVRSVKRLLLDVDLFITISEKMSETYKQVLGKNSVYYANMPNEKAFDTVSRDDTNNIVITYAGGLHYNRWKTLSMLGKAIQDYNNQHEGNVRLNIYSQSIPEKSIFDVLSIPNACSFMGSLTSDQVSDVLMHSDIVVHVESFEEEDIEATRLSFSTKIYEYMASGRPILAIGPNSVASIEYLKDCSFCVTSLADISEKLIFRITQRNEREQMLNRSVLKFNMVKKSRNNKENVIRAIVECGNDGI